MPVVGSWLDHRTWLLAMGVLLVLLVPCLQVFTLKPGPEQCGGGIWVSCRARWKQQVLDVIRPSNWEASIFTSLCSPEQINPEGMEGWGRFDHRERWGGRGCSQGGMFFRMCEVFMSSQTWTPHTLTRTPNSELKLNTIGLQHRKGGTSWRLNLIYFYRHPELNQSPFKHKQIPSNWF